MKLRDLTNTGETREAIRLKLQNAFDNFDKVHKKLKIDNKYNLKFENVKVSDKEYHIDDQKNAIIQNKYLTSPVTGKVKVIDDEGKEHDSYSGVIGRVPYYTGRGTFIYNGNEYTSSNQFRLKSGVYSRVKNSGDIESHVNVDSLSGPSFRINMNPKTGLLKTTFGKANANLYTLLFNAGVPDSELRKTWGDEIVEINKSKARSDELDRVYSHLYSGDKGKFLSQQEKAKKILKKMTEFKIDPSVTKRTIGAPYSFPNEDLLMRASRKILEINRGNEEPDDRDSLEFRTVHGPEDYFSEKIFNRKFAYNLLKQIKKKGIKEFPQNLVTKQLASLIRSDSRTQPIEETNPLEILDQQERFIVLGEGGIGALKSVPVELRNVHPSHLGLIDPVRGPESQSVGIDTRIAYDVRKGEDNHLYANVINAKTGKKEYIRSDKLASSNVGFPNELDKNKVHIIDSNGMMKIVPKSEVDYFVQTPNHTMSTLSNLVPFSSSVQGNRLFMAGKILSQILPLKDGEAPIVRSKIPGKEQSYDNLYGKKINGAIAKINGVVDKITEKKITVKSDDGKKVEHNLYNFFPFNRKTHISHRPIVKKGDRVKKDDVLANTQYTDKDGTLNMGSNLRVAFLPAKGQSYEDGIVISQTAAKKLTSEHMYTYTADLTQKGAIGGKDKFQAFFPTHYNIDQLLKLSENGVVKIGTVVENGDPLILLMTKKELSASDLILEKVSKKLKNQYIPNASEWDHEHKGIVTDVEVGLKYIKVNVVTMNPANTGDKLTGRYGNKGVVSSVWSDSEMPIDEAGKPIEVMLNPMGLISRINPAQVYETLLGKVEDRGKAKEFLVDSFQNEKIHEYISKILKENGISDTDDLINPVNGKKIKKILTGKMFFLKPSKTGEVGLSARDVGSYSADLLPARGGKEGAKRIGSMETNALLAHNAVHNLRDAITIKGEKNDDFWRAVKLGQPLPAPKTPFMYNKFLNSMRAGGINTKRDGTTLRLTPVTDTDVMEMSNGEIKNFKIVKSKDLSTERDGLFDDNKTGGLVGQKWTHIDLKEKVPNPLFVDFLAKTLGMQEKEFAKVFAEKGGEYIYNLLENIDLDEKEKELKVNIKKYKSTNRDNVIKVLRFIRGLKTNDKKLTDLMMSKVGVIPPVYRPVSFVGSNMSLIADANNVYKDLIISKNAYEDIKNELPYEALSEERTTLFNALKAVMGTGDPISPKFKQQKVKGFLKQIYGDQPKKGMFQRKILTKEQDLSARAVAIPDPTLDMDQVGLPEKIAWKIYSPFVMRRLITGGMPAVSALKEYESRSELAKKMLEAEMDVRPVIVNRAPSLHKYNIMSLYPKLRKDNVLAVPPIIEGGFNLDHDGDQVNIMVPATEDARLESIEKMLPSKNLLDPATLSAHYAPGHEAVYGAFHATSPKQMSAIRKFKTKQEALDAYKKGEIEINDAIDIAEL